MGMEQKRLEAIVYGVVQGVGFRYSVRDVARRLNLRGYVRNRPDHTVEVIAEGYERALRELLAFLQEGPSAASVESVEEKWLPISGRLGSFEVRF